MSVSLEYFLSALGSSFFWAWLCVLLCRIGVGGFENELTTLRNEERALFAYAGMGMEIQKPGATCDECVQ
jgi:hypothetical protein